MYRNIESAVALSISLVNAGRQAELRKKTRLASPKTRAEMNRSQLNVDEEVLGSETQHWFRFVYTFRYSP